MAERWFYAPTLPDDGARLTLDDVETQHAVARRLNVNDRVTLFDGQGASARAVVVALGHRGRGLSVQIDARSRFAPPPPLQLCAAIPKGERVSVLLDMATQLGMTRFTPLVCERGVVEPKASAPERWRRIVIEACKQSRRTYLPIIDPPGAPAEIVRQVSAWGHDTWFAHPASDATPATALRMPGDRGVAIMIGPEGGFSDTEVDALRALGARAVGLGAGILRIETAAVAALAAINIGRPIHT